MPASLIVDVTYRCNARCSYCRWGDGGTAKRHDSSTAELCADRELLRAADIGRVVLSGGEPLLHPHLIDVLQHYATAGVPGRIVITNGLLATGGRIEACHRAGATGFAFSLDTVDEATALSARATTSRELDRVLHHLRGAGEYARDAGLELTVNCVLSAANCDSASIRALAIHVAACGATAIKFQPVFDDGYLGSHAPELRLGRTHAGAIRRIANEAATWPISTNPPGFFADLAATCEGRPLDGTSCGLGGRAYVLQAGALVVCPWIGAAPVTRPDELPTALQRFRGATATCGTGPHCFCLQPREQRWRFGDALG